MQNIETIRKRNETRRRGLSVACMLLAIAALTSCDEHPSPSTPITTQAIPDSAAAYAALSATLAQCEAAQATCLERAGDDQRAQESCERAAASCRAQAERMEQQAESTLERETRRCHKLCSDEDAGPGGADDADGGTGDLDECLNEHAPRLPRCLRGLVTCLHDAGIFERDATRTEIRSCVREAHGCIRDRIAELRDRAGADARDAGTVTGGTGGEPAAGSGGASSSGSGAAGSGGADAGDAAAASEERGRRHHRWKPFWRR